MMFIMKVSRKSVILGVFAVWCLIILPIFAVGGINANTKSFKESRTAKTAKNGKFSKLTGTYFFGGSGMVGRYVDDFVVSLSNAGIAGVVAANGTKWSKGSIIRDGFYSAFNRGRDILPTDFLNLQSSPSSQFNLIGYSYGATLAANVAIDYVEAGGKVDNLVLIAAPINGEFVQLLRVQPGIRVIVQEDIRKFGNTIWAGQSGFSFFVGMLRLPFDFMFGESVFSMNDAEAGHFYYADPGAVGKRRRRDLAMKLVRDAGLR